MIGLGIDTYFFLWVATLKVWYDTFMPHKDEATRLAYYKEYRAKNRDQERERGLVRNAKLKAATTAYVVSTKEGKPCLDCDRTFPHFCMDYDHRPDEEKLFNLTQAAALGKSKAKIDAEIAKCDLVCACCHRVRTAERGNWHGLVSE